MRIPVALDGTLPPPMALLQVLRAHSAAPIAVPATPRACRQLPAILSMVNIAQVHWSGAAPHALRWRAMGGAQVTLLGDEHNNAAKTLIDHVGDLPGTLAEGAWDARDVDRACVAVRIADAHAACGGPAATLWPPVIAALTEDTTPGALPGDTVPLRSAPAWTAWNPLPWTRRLVVTIALSDDADVPWAVSDAQGAIHAVQVTQTSEGRQAVLTVEADALQGTALHASDDEPAAQAWDVSSSVIDNGRLRAELDECGAVVRLCVDGVFAQHDAPLLMPWRDGAPCQGAMMISVVEDGPVRSRIAVTTTMPDGRLDVLYTLHEFDNVLRVQAAWAGDPDRAPMLRCPGPRDACDVIGGDAYGPRRIAQQAHAFRAPMAPEPGWRWAQIDHPGGRAPLLIAPEPMVIHAHDGTMMLWLDGITNCALTVASPANDHAIAPGRIALELALPSMPLTQCAPLLRWADMGGVVPEWIRRDGTAVEVLLVDHSGRGARIWCFPKLPTPIPQACVVSAGAPRPLPQSRERDAWRIDLAPGEMLLMRWDMPA